MISWEVPRSKQVFNGRFAPARWGRVLGLPETHEITINPVRHSNRNARDVLGTLVHEMAHQEQEQAGKAPVKAFHNKNWCHIMRKIGLEPIITDAKGNPKPDKYSGRFATHSIVEDGPFSVAFDALAATGFELVWTRLADPERVKKPSAKKPTSMLVHTCPDCEAKARSKTGIVLYCGDHRKPVRMEVPEATDNEENDDEK